jgi:uncharacterized protein DUF4062
LLRLKIFVSSKTDELLEERKAIKTAFPASVYDVFIFEDTGARTESASVVYREEVLSCDIYIGIFKEKHSPATEEEYKLAFRSDKDILAYIAEKIKGRDKKLEKLLQKISERHKYKRYENITKLVRSVRRDVEQLRNRRFLEAKSAKAYPINGVASIEAETDLATSEHYDPVSFSDTLEIKGHIMNVSRKEIQSCMKAITTAAKDELKQEIWKRVEDLAKDSRIWKYDEVFGNTSRSSRSILQLCREYSEMDSSKC